MKLDTGREPTVVREGNGPCAATLFLVAETEEPTATDLHNWVDAYNDAGTGIPGGHAIYNDGGPVTIEVLVSSADDLEHTLGVAVGLIHDTNEHRRKLRNEESRTRLGVGDWWTRLIADPDRP